LGVARAIAVFAALVVCARAQDERRIVSPNGGLEFRIFVSQSDQGGLSRLAYRVLQHGKPIVDTSFLGLNIYNQEPLLGENAGLTESRTWDGGRYRGLVAEYMQNGSLGRRINVEVRVFDSGVAFRYVVPHSTMLDEILIEDEATEFDLAGDVRVYEVPLPEFPKMSLVKREGPARVTHLEGDSRVAFTGRTPLVCPWRVIAVGDANFRPDLEK
jgi:alpha-glucosidase